MDLNHPFLLNKSLVVVIFGKKEIFLLLSQKEERCVFEPVSRMIKE